MTEKEFVSEATKPRGSSLIQPIPLASTNYFLSRWALYAAPCPLGHGLPKPVGLCSREA